MVELHRYSNCTGISLTERQFEERHKLVKKAVLKPYEDFETAYKEYSTEVYRKTLDYIDKKRLRTSKQSLKIVRELSHKIPTNQPRISGICVFFNERVRKITLQNITKHRFYAVCGKQGESARMCNNISLLSPMAHHETPHEHYVWAVFPF